MFLCSDVSLGGLRAYVCRDVITEQPLFRELFVTQRAWTTEGRELSEEVITGATGTSFDFFSFLFFVMTGSITYFGHAVIWRIDSSEECQGCA